MVIQRIAIKRAVGLNGRGFSLRDNNGNSYWKHQARRDGFTVQCSLWRSKCPARGKVFNSEPNTVLLNIGHHHNRERVILAEFRKILHQRAKNERLPLRIIY
eukprot:XP_016657815.1 PREDICTED: uncharacterized protein LOC107883025 [Acyrthosiphon pisum]